MYIAGLYLSHTQGVESIVCLTLATQIFLAIRQHNVVVKRAQAEGGPIVKEPTSFVGRYITPIHGVSVIVPVFAYLGSVVLNGFNQPEWLQRWRLPYQIGVREAWVRTAACVAALVLSGTMKHVFDYLGKQFHYIGLREKPNVVTTGPYAIVRHPLYSVILAQQVAWAVMFWSYIPIIALSITAMAFAVKIPIEEQIIIDSQIGPEYVQYMQNVKSKIIPYIW